MEQAIKDLYKDNILHETMQRYHIAPDKIWALDGFENLIYEFRRGDKNYILRITHSIRRNPDLIRGEVDWINTLADGGVSVARAIPSAQDNLVELIDDGQGGSFLATAFVKAPGRRPWEVGWTPERYERYGALLGKMHTIAETYQVPNPAWKRPEWDGSNTEWGRWLPASEALAFQKYLDVSAYIHSLPKEKTSYGLIHQDAHQSNFFMDEDGLLTLFDFDDCGYSWFMNDIAIVLFYISIEQEDPLEFTQMFMPHFLRGYRQFHALDANWLKEIPVFLKLRELELYAVMYRDFDVNNIDNAWCARFMQGRKAKIDADVPFINFDFELFA
jgi:Ser/Thr protein kinase RdoA (MazF antagonist)